MMISVALFLYIYCQYSTEFPFCLQTNTEKHTNEWMVACYLIKKLCVFSVYLLLSAVLFYFRWKFRFLFGFISSLFAFKCSCWLRERGYTTFSWLSSKMCDVEAEPKTTQIKIYIYNKHQHPKCFYCSGSRIYIYLYLYILTFAIPKYESWTIEEEQQQM